MKFYEKGNKKAFESQIVFISLASKKKKMDLASTTKFVFAFASKLPMSVCVCRRTKMGRFLSNLFLNLWSVCVCFAVDTSFFCLLRVSKKVLFSVHITILRLNTG